MTLPTSQAIAEQIQSGKAVYERVEQRGGCGRVYVCICGDRKTKNAVKKAAKSLGMIYQTKGYGVDNALYVGYDNADGKAWSQGEQIAKNLKLIGVECYVDGVGD